MENFSPPGWLISIKRGLDELASFLNTGANNGVETGSINLASIKDTLMSGNSPPSPITLANLLNTNQRAFTVDTLTPAGVTFAEPVVVVDTVGAGTIVQQPSVLGNPLPVSGAIPGTAACVFTPTSGFTGEVEWSVEINGQDDQDYNFEIVAAEPETGVIDQSTIVDSPIPNSPQAVKIATAAVARETARETALKK